MDDLILLISELLRLSIFLFSIFDIEAKYAKPHGNKANKSMKNKLGLRNVY